MARRQQTEFPGGHLACGQFHALLKADEWTALQWMRFRFGKADSAIDLLLREQPIPYSRADELAAFIATVHSQSSESLYPLRFGRGAHLQRDVQALVSRAPRNRGGPAHLRDLLPVDTAISTLGGLVRRAPEEAQPVVATSAMTLLRHAWDGHCGRLAGFRHEEEEGDVLATDDELVAWLEMGRPGVGEAVWMLALNRCMRLQEAADAVVARYTAAAAGLRGDQTLARRVPGFPDEVYRQAIGLAQLTQP